MKAGQKITMKYLIIGAGGTGGVTGYYMKKAGKDVTLIARGEHLKTDPGTGPYLRKNVGQNRRKRSPSRLQTWNITQTIQT